MIARAIIILFLLCFAKLASARDRHRPLHQESYDEIMKYYSIVGDFYRKSATRPITDKEVFWRYPMQIPDITFPYDFKLDTKEEFLAAFPRTEGRGRVIAHLNRARALILEGELESAKKTLLSAKARYGKSYPFHRRTDYFLAALFMDEALKESEQRKQRNLFNNASTFISYAFQVKRDLKDPVLDPMNVRYLYNLAAIYFNYKQYGNSFGTTEEALSYLLQKGLKEHRTKFRRLRAESFVKNRTYLEAAQEFDVALREDAIEKSDAAAIFARIADIYFDLNNFELAEEMYSIAMKIDNEAGNVNPSQYVLRGESLFWLGRYSEAQKMFHQARQAVGSHVTPLSDQLRAVASIRAADAWLAQVDLDQIKAAKQSLRLVNEKLTQYARGTAPYRQLKDEKEQTQSLLRKREEPLEKAKVNYYRHLRQFSKDHTADHARIRIACLELPEYGGENIRHARSLLEKIRSGSRGLELYDKEKTKEEIEKELAEAKAAEAAEDKTIETARDKLEAVAEKVPEVGPEFTMPPIPKEAMHMAWGCEVASYAQHERSEDMLSRVSQFVGVYPQSSFIAQLIEPVRETQSNKIWNHIENGDDYLTALFYEKNKDRLFKELDQKLATLLFYANINIHRSEMANQFYPMVSFPKKDDDLIRLATFASETADKSATRNQTIAKRLEKHSFKLDDTVETRVFIDRILSSRGHKAHTQWLYQLFKRWGEKNARVICDLSYPLLSNIWSDPMTYGYTEASAKKLIDDMLNKHLGEILQFQTNCGYSLLEFEFTVYKNDLLTLHERLKKRPYLPINEVTANLLWNLSERLLSEGHKPAAKEWWQLLTSTQNPNLAEVAYARARLDERKTELENLWE